MYGLFKNGKMVDYGSEDVIAEKCCMKDNLEEHLVYKSNFYRPNDWQYRPVTWDEIEDFELEMQIEVEKDVFSQQSEFVDLPF